MHMRPFIFLIPLLIAILAAAGTRAQSRVPPEKEEDPRPARIDRTSDRDGDGIPDYLDKCPAEKEDRDGFEDRDGCPDPDNDRDGIPDASDKCPNTSEDRDNFEDGDGCPDLDNDQDGIPDRMDKCPNVPGPGSHQGCPPPKPVERVIVAVFDIHDASGRSKRSSLNQLTEYLSVRVTQVAGYRVVPRNQIKERLKSEARGSYKECYDEQCQIDLGRALAAAKSLDTKLLRFGTQCALTATLYDLKSQTAEKAASVRTGCTEAKLMDGIDQVAKQLAGK